MSFNCVFWNIAKLVSKLNTFVILISIKDSFQRFFKSIPSFSI